MVIKLLTTVDDVPGWNDLVGQEETFYLSREWLRFVDSYGEAERCYCVDHDHARPLAGLPAHWATEEANPLYVPSHQLSQLAGSGLTLLTLGGRRGYLSGVLAGDQRIAANAIPALVDAARDAFPQSSGWWWPFLSTSASQQVIDALAGRQRPHVSLIEADCALDVPGRCIEDYVDSLPNRGRRSTVRREMKRFAASGLAVTRERLSDCWERAGALLANVQRKYGHDDSPTQMAEALRRQAEMLDDRSVVFACRDAGELVAFSLAYRWGTELAVRVVGFDYERLHDAFEYAQVLVYSPLELCYERGLRRIHLGAASLSSKCRRGAHVRPLWALYDCPFSPPAPTDPVEVVLNNRLQALVQQLPNHEASTFAREVSEAAHRWQGA